MSRRVRETKVTFFLNNISPTYTSPAGFGRSREDFNGQWRDIIKEMFKVGERERFPAIPGEGDSFFRGLRGE